MTQPPPMPWDADPEVDEQGNPVAAPAAAPSAGPAPWDADPEVPAVEPPEAPGSSARTYGRALLGGAVESLNPVNIAKSMVELGRMGSNLVTRPYAPDTLATTEKTLGGLKETGAAAVGMRGVEEAGRAHGALLTGLLPFGRAAAWASRRGLPIVGSANEASRAYNIKRALRSPQGKGPTATKINKDLEAMSPEIELPITWSEQTLAKKLAERKAATGAEVGASEAALPDVDIPVSNLADRLERPPGQTTIVDVPSTLFPGGTVEVSKFVPDSPAAAARYVAARRAFEESGGKYGTINAHDAVRMKRSLQKEAKEKSAYATEELKQAAEQARERAAVVRAELESLPGPEARRFSRANRAHHVMETIEPLAEAEATRRRSMPLAGRGVEMLIGRAVPGSGFARQALGGLVGGAILDSTLFHTASAAAKRQAIRALESGQPQLATDILFRAAVVQTQARRRADAALRAQGEGVVQP